MAFGHPRTGQVVNWQYLSCLALGTRRKMKNSIKDASKPHHTLLQTSTVCRNSGQIPRADSYSLNYSHALLLRRGHHKILSHYTFWSTISIQHNEHIYGYTCTIKSMYLRTMQQRILPLSSFRVWSMVLTTILSHSPTSVTPITVLHRPTSYHLYLTLGSHCSAPSSVSLLSSQLRPAPCASHLSLCLPCH